MSNFAYDIQLGFLTFPFVALALSLPYMVYQYRRFGAISAWKTVVVFSFVLYCLCACYLIALPLPKDHHTIVAIAQTPQLDPMHLFDQLAAVFAATDFSLADRSTWAPTFKNKVVYEAVFNVMLTMPLGAYLGYLFRCRWWQVLLIGFCTTLTFEVSQLTGLFGIYEHPYRLFDVDDMLLNTLGAMLGFWLALPLIRALPPMDRIDDSLRARGLQRVTATRRIVAFFLDCLATVTLFSLAWLFASPTNLQIARSLALDPSVAEARGAAWRFLQGISTDPVSALLVLAAAALVVFVATPIITQGRTPGQALCGLKIVTVEGARPPWHAYFTRYALLGLVLSCPLWLAMLTPDEVEGVGGSTFVAAAALAYGAWTASLIVRALVSMAGHPAPMLNEIASGTRLVPSKASGSPPPTEGPRPSPASRDERPPETAPLHNAGDGRDMRTRPLPRS